MSRDIYFAKELLCDMLCGVLYVMCVKQSHNPKTPLCFFETEQKTVTMDIKQVAQKLKADHSWTNVQVADLLGVSERTVQRYTSKSTAAASIKSKEKTRNEDVERFIAEVLGACPDKTLADVCECVFRQTDRMISRSTVCRMLKKMKWGRKRIHPKNQKQFIPRVVKCKDEFLHRILSQPIKDCGKLVGR